MSAKEVATAFVQHYYTSMDSNPSALAGLYVSTIIELHYCSCQTPNVSISFLSQQPTSMLSFEGQEIQGAEAILGKYGTMGALQHNIPEFTMDVQVSECARGSYDSGEMRY